VLTKKAELARFTFASMSDRDENERSDLPLLKRVWPTWSSSNEQGTFSGTTHSSGFADQVGQVPAIPGKSAHDRDLLLGVYTPKVQEVLVFQA
jgi:hypothetical protein